MCGSCLHTLPFLSHPSLIKMMKSFWDNLRSTWKQPADRFTIEHLRHLYTQLARNPVITADNQDTIIEALRELSELIIWGDQHEDEAFFDLFMEKNVLGYFMSILFSKTASNGVKRQLIQTLSIIIENLRAQRSLFFLLSNNYINDLITYPFDFDEDLLAQYISLLKTLALKLDAETVQFFFNDKAQLFPLLTVAIRFAHVRESMVRVGVRNLTLQVFRVSDARMQRFVVKSVAEPYFVSVALHARAQCSRLHEIRQRDGGGSRTRLPRASLNSSALTRSNAHSAHSSSSSRSISAAVQSASQMHAQQSSRTLSGALSVQLENVSAREAVEEIEDILGYFDDVCGAMQNEIGRIAARCLVEYWLFAQLFGSLGANLLVVGPSDAVCAHTCFVALTSLLESVRHAPILDAAVAHLLLPSADAAFSLAPLDAAEPSLCAQVARRVEAYPSVGRMLKHGVPRRLRPRGTSHTRASATSASTDTRRRSSDSSVSSSVSSSRTPSRSATGVSSPRSPCATPSRQLEDIRSVFVQAIREAANSLGAMLFLDALLCTKVVDDALLRRAGLRRREPDDTAVGLGAADIVDAVVYMLTDDEEPLSQEKTMLHRREALCIGALVLPRLAAVDADALNEQRRQHLILALKRALLQARTHLDGVDGLELVDAYDAALEMLADSDSLRRNLLHDAQRLTCTPEPHEIGAAFRDSNDSVGEWQARVALLDFQRIVVLYQLLFCGADDEAAPPLQPTVRAQPLRAEQMVTLDGQRYVTCMMSIGDSGTECVNRHIVFMGDHVLFTHTSEQPGSLTCRLWRSIPMNRLQARRSSGETPRRSRPSQRHSHGNATRHGDDVERTHLVLAYKGGQTLGRLVFRTANQCYQVHTLLRNAFQASYQRRRDELLGDTLRKITERCNS